MRGLMASSNNSGYGETVFASCTPNRQLASAQDGQIQYEINGENESAQAAQNQMKFK
jgi:hypothetical protein